jgi:hypothetical protein
VSSRAEERTGLPKQDAAGGFLASSRCSMKSIRAVLPEGYQKFMCSTAIVDNGWRMIL